MSGQKIIDALEDAQRGDFSRCTVNGQTWVRIEPGQIIIKETVLDTAHAVGFRDGFNAATGGSVKTPYLATDQ